MKNNRFIKLIHEKKIEDLQLLKRTFWQLSKQCHPDAGKLNDEGRLFKEICNEYREAVQYLEKSPVKVDAVNEPPSVKLNKIHLFELLADLFAGQFPLDQRIAEKNKAYRQRYQELLVQFELWDPQYREIFLEFEKEYSLIKKGSDPKLKGISRMINHVFYNLFSFHYTGIEYVKKSVLKCYLDIRDDLVKKDLAATRKIMELLMEIMNVL